jgi:hypothetical protein
LEAFRPVVIVFYGHYDVTPCERLFALKYEGTDARIIEVGAFVGAGDDNDVICAAIAIG